MWLWVSARGYSIQARKRGGGGARCAGMCHLCGHGEAIIHDEEETDLGSLMFLLVTSHLCAIIKPNKLIGSSV